MASKSSTTTKVTGSYFEEKKKGEMNELKNALNNMINENDSKKGREVIRKVIGYMTLGMDASLVFSEMCRASFTNDEIMKKMIYFYLTTYAEDNPDLAIMAVNTFKKDCQHSSSRIRGLALRNLCSFKSSDYVNNVLPVIRELLNDFEPYVKKTAIMGVLKVFYVEPATIFNDSGILNDLSLLIRDSDPLVSVNALLALDQILVSEGGIHLNSKLFFYLLNRLKEYNEWQQTSIIEILYRYQPSKENQKERYQIMNILWEKLKHSSTPLVLGSIKMILKLTEKKEDLFKNIVETIKAPLLTLMTGNENSGTFETTYIVLQHIEYVIRHMGGKKFYEKDFKYFYCKIDEPTYIKSLKVTILGLLANEYNLGDLLNELNDYANDVDLEMARKSVRTLTDITLSLPEVAKAMLINLVSFYKQQKQHLVNETVISFYLILRKYPKLFSEVDRCLLECRNQINETQSTKALIWICGTFSHQINQAPYILEEYIDNEDQFYSYDASIKEVLLTSILKTFLKRPVQTYKILGRVLKLIIHGQKCSISLIDHACFYYQALEHDVEEVKKGFAAMQSDMTKFNQESGEVCIDEDFNSMGIVYKQKQVKFTKSYDYFVAMRNKELGLQPNQQVEDNVEQETPQLQQQLEGGIQTFFERLQSDLLLAQSQYEQIWNSLGEAEQAKVKTVNEDDLNEQTVEELFGMWRISTMAAAEDDEGSFLKFFMYARETDLSYYYCIQLQINKLEKEITISSKGVTKRRAQWINQYIAYFLRENGFVN